MRSLCTAMKSSSWSLQLEKAHAQQRRPSAAKNKLLIFKRRRRRSRVTDIENKLVVTSGGEGRGKGQDMGKGVRGTNY